MPLSREVTIPGKEAPLPSLAQASRRARSSAAADAASVHPAPGQELVAKTCYVRKTMVPAPGPSSSSQLQHLAPSSRTQIKFPAPSSCTSTSFSSRMQLPGLPAPCFIAKLWEKLDFLKICAWISPPTHLRQGFSPLLTPRDGFGARGPQNSHTQTSLIHSGKHPLAGVCCFRSSSQQAQEAMGHLSRGLR